MEQKTGSRWTMRFRNSEEQWTVGFFLALVHKLLEIDFLGIVVEKGG